MRAPAMSALAMASLRHARRAPAQLALSVIGIALGVAVMVAIDIAISSSKRAFNIAQQSVSGRATHRIVAAGEGVDERVFGVLFRELGQVPATPVVQGQVWPLLVSTPKPRDQGRAAALTLLGVDPFSDGPFRGHLGERGERIEGAPSGVLPLSSLLTEPGAVVVGARTAARLGLVAGGAMMVRARGREHRLRIAGIVHAATSAGGQRPRPGHATKPGRQIATAPADPSMLDDLVIADVSTAQEILAMPGRLSAIDLIIDNRALVRTLQNALPAGTRLIVAAARARANLQMTQAFNLNLRMLALLALVVGLFLIYNTVTFSVVRRRHQFGVLRVLGATQRDILTIVLGEAAVLGAAGAVLGVALGIGLADQLLALVTRTVNDLYMAVSAREVHVEPRSLALAFLAGTGAAVLAALVPALESVRRDPANVLVRSGFEGALASLAPRAGVVGLVLMAASALLLYGGSLNGSGAAAGWGSLQAGFVGFCGLVAGAACVAPVATVYLMRLARPVAVFLMGTVGALAVAGALSSLSRTAVAVMALMVALSATIGVGVMVDSFRLSVKHWLDGTLRADIYVGGPGSAQERSIAPALVKAISALPSVAELSLGRRIDLENERGQVSVLALSMAHKSYSSFDLLAPLNRQAQARMWRSFEQSGAILVTEPYANRYAVGPGGAVELLTPAGTVKFPVAGIYRDYASERGSLLMSRRTYLRWWRDSTLTGMGVYLHEDASVAVRAQTLATIQAMLPVSGALVANSNHRIKQASMAIFDRTFTITQVVRLLAVTVAFFGVMSAMLALQLERGRHFAMLRAQGMTQAQIFALITTETGLLGLTAGLLSLPLGLALAHALVEVINRRAFGWSMSFHVDAGLLSFALVMAVGAAMLAGLWPAWKMAAAEPAVALRGE